MDVCGSTPCVDDVADYDFVKLGSASVDDCLYTVTLSRLTCRLGHTKWTLRCDRAGCAQRQTRTNVIDACDCHLLSAAACYHIMFVWRMITESRRWRSPNARELYDSVCVLGWCGDSRMRLYTAYPMRVLATIMATLPSSGYMGDDEIYEFVYRAVKLITPNNTSNELEPFL